MLASLETCFAIAIGWLTFRLWPRATLPEGIFFSAALMGVMLSEAPSIREMLYWLPGVACYTLPACIVILVLWEFIHSVEETERIHVSGTAALAGGCFVASLCNEFSGPWIFGILIGSLFTRLIFRSELQIKVHAVTGVATLIGFAVLLLAPGNTVRMGQFPVAGDLIGSIKAGYTDYRLDLKLLLAQPTLLTWLGVVFLFTIVQPEPKRVETSKRLFLAILTFPLCLACGYLAYFTH
jgi:hypothetical protein